MCDQLEASPSVHVNRANERTGHHRQVTDALSLSGKLSVDDNRTLVDKQMTIAVGLLWQLRCRSSRLVVLTLVVCIGRQATRVTFIGSTRCGRRCSQIIDQDSLGLLIGSSVDIDTIGSCLFGYIQSKTACHMAKKRTSRRLLLSDKVLLLKEILLEFQNDASALLNFARFVVVVGCVCFRLMFSAAFGRTQCLFRLFC